MKYLKRFLKISGRRRSNRLIESLWLYNWPKKGPIYIKLDSGSTRETDDIREVNAGVKRTELSKNAEHSEARFRGPGYHVKTKPYYCYLEKFTEQ